MATRFALGLTVGAAVLLGACAGSRAPSATRLFAFDYEGSTYAIISTDVVVGEGNVLLRRDRTRPFLRADDRNQDGTLDTLIAGDLTLDEADRVYAAGLAEAATRGKKQDRVPLPTYTLRLSDGTFSVQTVPPAQGSDEPPHNRFVAVMPAHALSIIALDREADGLLDRVEQGSVRLDTLQVHYAQVLAQGVREGRVEKRGAVFLVLPEQAPAQRPVF